MGLFDKLNHLMNSIGLSERCRNKTALEKSKITNNKTANNYSSELKQGRESLGLDLSPVLNDPKIKSILVAHAKESCNAIESIPTQHREKVAEAVLANFYGTLPEKQTLVTQLQTISQMTKEDAVSIARDQTSKLTARLNQARQEAIGVNEYIWRTVLERCNHSERNGKKFKWKSPPPGGHPGQSHSCACYAEAVIDTKKIVRAAKKHNGS